MTHKFVYDSRTQLVRPVPGQPRLTRRPRRRPPRAGSRWFIVAFAVVSSVVGFSVARAVALSRSAPATYTSAR